MCRMLAVRSVDPEPLGPLLLDGPHSLLALSHEHRHGWGIGQWVDQRLLVDKGTGPAHADPEFARVASTSVTRCAVAHVRRVSVGDQRLENTHPFRAEGLVFAHNGTVQRFAENRAALLAQITPELRERIQGSTDSEHAFYLFLTLLGPRRALADLAGALAETVERLLRLPTSPESPHLLNFLVSDGRGIVGCAVGKELGYHLDPARFVLASEAPSPAGWTELAWGEVIGVDGGDDARPLQVHHWTLGGLSRG